MFFIKAFAEIRGGRNETQSQFYNRVGTSRLGGNVRTRGIPAPIRQMAARGQAAGRGGFARGGRGRR